MIRKSAGLDVPLWHFFVLGLVGGLFWVPVVVVAWVVL